MTLLVVDIGWLGRKCMTISLTCQIVSSFCHHIVSSMQSFVQFVTVAMFVSVVSSDNMGLGLGIQIGVGCKPKHKYTVNREKNMTDTAENCGHDAYYVSDTNDKYVSFGVADGFEGWAERNYDPTVFSKALCAGARQAFIEALHPDPLNIMKKSYQNLAKGGDANVGSSTATFLVFDRSTGRLETANMGDSGYLILRNGSVIFRSEAQAYQFNVPYQLSLYPSSWKKGPHKLRIYEPFNLEQDSFVTSHSLQAGDVVVVASDGLFDNVFHDQIERIVQAKLDIVYKLYPHLSTTLAPPTVSEAFLTDVNIMVKHLSDGMALLAKYYAKEKNMPSPFSELAKEAGYKHQGG
jgi:protein phosphatase PTC7